MVATSVKRNAFFMKAVRTHHDLLKALSRKDRESQKLRECKKLMSDPHKYAKTLLNPPNKLKPALTERLQMTTSTKLTRTLLETVIICLQRTFLVLSYLRTHSTLTSLASTHSLLCVGRRAMDLHLV